MPRSRRHGVPGCVVHLKQVRETMSRMCNEVTRVSLLCATLFAVPLASRAHGQSVQYVAGATQYRAMADTGPVSRAQAAVARDPRNVALLIQLGIAQSGARQFRQAITTFSRALELEPDNAMLYRWRGHRFLSVREYDRAIADFTRGLARDSANYGIWYHLGVWRFVHGDFVAAAVAFARAQRIAPDAAELAGSVDWRWMSLARAGQLTRADSLLRARPDSMSATNAYSQRLRLYRGEIGPEAVITSSDTGDVAVATLSYGIGNWHLVRGDTATARNWFERAVRSGGWPAFGFMAAEAELRRLR